MDVSILIFLITTSSMWAGMGNTVVLTPFSSDVSGSRRRGILVLFVKNLSKVSVIFRGVNSMVMIFFLFPTECCWKLEL